MGKINVLDQNTINQIAAGEVIDRPASVVKELVENAIDAGATAITIELKDGGLSLIRITDNGSGIDQDDIHNAFLPHATSKIKDAKDLFNINSLGFRGEALSSIAAVCQVELISKTRDSITGYSYKIEGGKEISLEEIGAPDGTTFLVKNIFFNTPARRKFLKSPQTEGLYILELCEHMALSAPNVAFKVIINGQIKLNTSGNNKLKDVIYAVYGKDIASNLITVNLKKSGLVLSGFIGKPVINRSNKAFENFYVNGRYVKVKLLERALEDAYKNYMMVHKHPFCVLFVNIPANLLDVNVHPSKMELRFSQEDILYTEIYEYLFSLLSGRELIQETEIKPVVKTDITPEIIIPAQVTATSEIITQEPKSELKPEIKTEDKPVLKPLTKPAHIEPFETKRASVENMVMEPPASVYAEPKKLPNKTNSFIPIAEPKNVEQQTLFDDVLLSKKARVKHKYLGQLFKTYLLIEYEDKLYMIDQHAAHEKVLYEQNMQRLKDKKSGSQPLATPLMLHLSERQSQTLKDSMDTFEMLGFELEEFGSNTYCCRSIPSNMYGLDQTSLLYEMLDDMAESYKSKTPETLIHKIATISCKAAVKGNMTLSDVEANALIDELLSLENPYFCPHGRPSIISMTKTELEKKFKRIV